MRASFFMALLASLACGGGGHSPDPGENNDPVGNSDEPANPAVNVETGDVHMQINPAMTDVPAVQIELRNSVTGEVLATAELMPGPDGLVIEDVPVEADEVAFACPDFCIAMPNGNMGRSVCENAWNVHPLIVVANEVTPAIGTLFPVLNGPWQTPDGVRQVWVEPTADGSGGATGGFSPVNFQVVGYTATPTAGPCQGTPLAIEENGTRITVDCGVGTPYSHTRAE